MRTLTNPRMTLMCGILLIVCQWWTSPSALGASEEKTNSDYSLVLTENDTLCDSMLSFYTAHIKDEDDPEKGLVEDQLSSSLNTSEPTFLQGSLPLGQRIFKNIDIYNDQKPRIVVVNDTQINGNFITLYTQLLVLRPDVPNPFSPSDGTSIIDEDDPAVELWVDFSRGGSSASPDQGGSYLLRKYPQFDFIYTTVQKQVKEIGEGKQVHNLIFLPAIGQSIVQRLMSFDGTTYVSARERGDQPGSHILIYKLQANGSIDDICYLERN